MITLNSLIAKIYYALIIFSFSQKHNLLKITNSALKKERKEEKEKNNKKKIIKKTETRRK